LQRGGFASNAHRDVLPFGLAEVDRRLPQGGLALGALHEIAEAGAACEYASIAVLFAAGIAARLDGPVLWCVRGRDLFAPALARAGLPTERVMYCETWKDGEVLPAMEEGLRCAGLAAVVGEVSRLSLTASRRLQLAAEHGGVTALVVRRLRNAAEAGESVAAMTRWRLAPVPCAGGFHELGRARWRLNLVRCRGGEPHSWLVEACDAQGRLALPAALADRPAAPQEQRRAASG
jgi:protein ImuA